MKFLNKINPQVGFNLLSIFVLWLIFILFSVSVGYEMRVTYNITYFITRVRDKRSPKKVESAA